MSPELTVYAGVKTLKKFIFLSRITAGSLVPNLTSMVSSSDPEKLSPIMVMGTPPWVPPVDADIEVI